MTYHITNVRSAVLALAEPLVANCPELTIDRVVGDYCVSNATLGHDVTDFTPDGRIAASVLVTCYESYRAQAISRIKGAVQSHWQHHPRAVY